MARVAFVECAGDPVGDLDRAGRLAVRVDRSADGRARRGLLSNRRHHDAQRLAVPDAAGKQDALGFVPIDSATKGQANGVASLDGTGKVPAAQLPAYVDDVVEYANLAAFPGAGAAGVIYVALDTGKVYRWSGSAYAEIVGAPGSTDAVPEGAVNLYFTNLRAQNALAATLGNTDADLVAEFNAALA